MRWLGYVRSSRVLYIHKYELWVKLTGPGSNIPLALASRHRFRLGVQDTASLHQHRLPHLLEAVLSSKMPEPASANDGGGSTQPTFKLSE
jgi:hypothetical protein